MASTNSSAAVNPALLTYNNVLLHHVPNLYAPSALVAILAGAIAWGIMLSELAYNVGFDLRLIRSPGWSRPLRAATRSAYFITRIGAFINLTLSLIYSNVPGLSCKPFYASMRATWYLSVVCVDFIFFTRTLTLYGWPKRLWIPLLFFSSVYIILGGYDTANWGTPFQIPASNFCGYWSANARDGRLLHKLYLFQYSLSLAVDTVVLVLTCLRLASASESSGHSWQTTSGHSVGAITVQGMNMSQVLIVQGFVLYGSLEACHLGIVLVYFLSDYQQSWASMVFTLVILIKTLTSSTLVRLTSDAVQKTRAQPTSQRIYYSDEVKSPAPASEQSQIV